ncbi:TrkH family potassium uptake protein [Stomatohabitans albus]
MALCSVGLSISTVVEGIYDGPNTTRMAWCSGAYGLISLVLFLTTETPTTMKRRSVFIATTGIWLSLPLIGMVPYLLTGTVTDPINAWFESTSGFTATGSTILGGDMLLGVSKGMLFWRSITQWIGGIGVVALSLLVLPFLGSKGMDLLGVEAPGPINERLAPRARETVQIIVFVYMLLTGACAVLYVARGIPTFDAINHALTTVATGGFSTRPTSLLEWSDDPVIVLGAPFFMFVSACNLSLVWAIGRGHIRDVLRDGELRFFIYWTLTAVGLACVVNGLQLGWTTQVFTTTLFTVVSFITTGGLDVVDFSAWPPLSTFILFIVQFPGGMTGSTAGGMKMMRMTVMARYGLAEVSQQTRPHEIISVRLSRTSPGIPDKIIKSVLGFMGMFMAIWVVSVGAMTAIGVSVETAMSATTSSLSNVGQALGEVANGDFTVLPKPALIVALVNMEIGRLEILPVLMMFSAIRDSLMDASPFSSNMR